MNVISILNFRKKKWLLNQDSSVPEDLKRIFKWLQFPGEIPTPHLYALVQKCNYLKR